MPKRDPEPLQATRSGDSLVVTLADAAEHGDAVYVASHDFGVRDKGDETFRLMYYAKAGPLVDSAAWQTINTADKLAFDIAVKINDGKIQLQTSFEGKPTADAEVAVVGPLADEASADNAADDFSGQTDADGKYAFAASAPGRYSIRIRHLQQEAGEVDQRAYEQIRHYATLTLDVPASAVRLAGEILGKLPMTLTSFGAAMLDDAVYVYGGNTGSSHQYSAALQNDALLRMDLAGGSWQTISRGPHLQGLAMVSHGGKLYISTISGTLQRLSDDGSAWRVVGQTPVPRFFHRMLPASDDSLVVIGGANMRGRIQEVEKFSVPSVEVLHGFYWLIRSPAVRFSEGLLRCPKDGSVIL